MFYLTLSFGITKQRHVIHQTQQIKHWDFCNLTPARNMLPSPHWGQITLFWIINKHAQTNSSNILQSTPTKCQVQAATGGQESPRFRCNSNFPTHSFLLTMTTLPKENSESQSQKNFLFLAANCSVQLLSTWILFSVAKSVSIYLWDHTWIWIELYLSAISFKPELPIHSFLSYKYCILKCSSAQFHLSNHGSPYYFMMVSITTFWLDLHHLLRFLNLQIFEKSSSWAQYKLPQILL